MNILQCLENFTVVVEYKSFSAAAQVLNSSPSKISKQITYLEEELKLKLFIRSTKKLLLTDQGQILYEKVGNLFNELKEIKSIAYQEQYLLQGLLKICLIVGPAVIYFTSAIAQFMKKHPKIIIDLRVGADIIDANQYTYDLIISFDSFTHPQIICKKIFSIQRGVYASPNYLKCYGNLRKDEDLINHNCLINTLYGLQNKWILNNKVIHVAGNFTSNNADVLKQAAIDGLGLIWVPSFSVREEIKSGKLLQILPSSLSPEIMLYALFKKHKKNNLMIDLFLGYICEKIVIDDIISID
ncbi:LysR family transcriptional regulator [Legionella longbeachae]|uniref:Putative transcriptional regulator, LysR family n=1 Tax=Legionella longbeachae serogroup 1 (strain NSW150) TaxID=661367 RepID=D3HIY4_LEGLN|nr:LysR family transcriptional regulator [Legionella longbeachae]VEE02872.1 LysR family transcriptional regulator [Legionella oakridgensis]HBD7398923.1 LysR family transcriptional regulator [Legionella pneumophila]ARB90885.1 LysR family transcriptional regulator [Legionella longbeachae]ARM32689.1 LysR family transcriptional regulator [Legionella longbeachae]EEZ94537.1 LysR family transcriptional regulator [Legionella longbeachae D-4968]